LNTDDAGVFDSNMADEYFLAVTHFNLSWREVVRIGRNSLEYSFAEPDLKRALVARYDAAVAAFEKKYDRADWRELLRGVPARPSGYARRSLGM
jgi:adenosine deaminase CECR1